MSMSRADHYRRAQELMAPMDHRVAEGKGPGPDAGWRTMLAQVHATLAIAPAEAGGAHAGPVLGGTREEPTVFGLPLDEVAALVDLKASLERALAELAADTSPLRWSGSAAARFIQERVLGGEAQDPGVDYRADSDRLASLVGRLVRLADDLEDAGPSHVAQRIREELSR